VTWTSIVVLAAGAYALKAAGLLGPAWLDRDGRLLPPRVEAVAALVPVALLSALIVVQTLSEGRSLVLDARLAGMAVAAGAVALRAPFVLVIVLAAGVTAALRAVG
jgi:uncharacterized membrane protein